MVPWLLKFLLLVFFERSPWPLSPIREVNWTFSTPLFYKKLKAKVLPSVAVLRLGLFLPLTIFAFPQPFPELIHSAGMRWRRSLVAGAGHHILCGWSVLVPTALCVCYTCLLWLSLDGGQASQ